MTVPGAVPSAQFLPAADVSETTLKSRDGESASVSDEPPAVMVQVPAASSSVMDASPT